MIVNDFFVANKKNNKNELVVYILKYHDITTVHPQYVLDSPYLWTQWDIHRCNGPSRWCTSRCSHRVGMHTHLCRCHSGNLGNQAHSSIDTGQSHPDRWRRSCRAVTDTHLCLLHSVDPGNPRRTGTRSRSAPTHRWRYYSTGHKHSLAHSSCSHPRCIRWDSGTNIRWFHPHSSSWVPYRGCSHIHWCFGCSWDHRSRRDTDRCSSQFLECLSTWTDSLRFHTGRINSHSVRLCI